MYCVLVLTLVVILAEEDPVNVRMQPRPVGRPCFRSCYDLAVAVAGRAVFAGRAVCDWPSPLDAGVTWWTYVAPPAGGVGPWFGVT